MTKSNPYTNYVIQESVTHSRSVRLNQIKLHFYRKVKRIASLVQLGDCHLAIFLCGFNTANYNKNKKKILPEFFHLDFCFPYSFQKKNKILSAEMQVWGRDRYVKDKAIKQLLTTPWYETTNTTHTVFHLVTSSQNLGSIICSFRVEIHGLFSEDLPRIDIVKFN